MTTAEFLVCELMDCGQNDIESCFGNMDDDILIEAIKDCKEADSIDMGFVWEIAIKNAAYKVFGDIYELIEPQFNYMASDVAFVGNPNEIEDFESKAEEFERLTGFTLQY